MAGVELKELVEPAELFSDIKVSEGLSSQSPEISINIGGEWITLGSTNKSTAPLDKIGSHELNMDAARKAAERDDPTLAEMLRTFCSEEGSTQHRPNLQGLEKATSRDFGRQDLTMLVKAGIIDERERQFSLKAFKVKKKDPAVSRFITDCRVFNDRFTAFKGERMNLPRLHDIMEHGARFPVIWSIDAKAYFFQFKLAGEAATWFPMQFKVDGKLRSYCMSRLPMGCSTAPIIAQRVSNLVIKRTRERMSILGLDGFIEAWVDNFLVFASEEATATLIMKALQGQLHHFNILCSDVDKSGRFLGLERTGQGLQLDSSFRTTLKEDLKRSEHEEHLTKKAAEILFGKLLWLNYAIARIPLAKCPHTLETLRTLPRLGSGEGIPLSPGLRQELGEWERQIDTVFCGRALSDKHIPDVWSDATPRRIAVVSGHVVLMAELDHDIDIALAEAVAAAWGLIINNFTAHLHIDNLGIAHVFAKGHCKSPPINRVLANAFEHEVCGSITWVPTRDQVADGPTRGSLPNYAALQKEEWLTIRSMWFTEGK